jgi:hypothetical protein
MRRARVLGFVWQRCHANTTGFPESWSGHVTETGLQAQDFASIFSRKIRVCTLMVPE